MCYSNDGDSMKIVLMSDSHGRNVQLDNILERHKDAAYFFHCGDIGCDEYVYPQIVCVAGNNDYFGNFPDKRILELGNHRVLMMHSHLCYGMNRLKRMSEMAKIEQCDTVFFGHTHVACDEVYDGIRCINPGSLYYSRDGRPISYCVIDIEEDFNVEFKFAPFE